VVQFKGHKFNIKSKSFALALRSRFHRELYSARKPYKSKDDFSFMELWNEYQPLDYNTWNKIKYYDPPDFTKESE
jgi:hypothetical protein